MARTYEFKNVETNAIEYIVAKSRKQARVVYERTRSNKYTVRCVGNETMY